MKKQKAIDRLTEDVQNAVAIVATSNETLLHITLPLLVLVAHLERHQSQRSVAYTDKRVVSK